MSWESKPPPPSRARQAGSFCSVYTHAPLPEMALGENVSCVCPRAWGEASVSVMGAGSGWGVILPFPDSRHWREEGAPILGLHCHTGPPLSLYPVLAGPERWASRLWPTKVGAGMSCSVPNPAWGSLAGHVSEAQVQNTRPPIGTYNLSGSQASPM